MKMSNISVGVFTHRNEQRETMIKLHFFTEFVPFTPLFVSVYTDNTIYFAYLPWIIHVTPTDKYFIESDTFLGSTLKSISCFLGKRAINSNQRHRITFRKCHHNLLPNIIINLKDVFVRSCKMGMVVHIDLKLGQERAVEAKLSRVWRRFFSRTCSLFPSFTHYYPLTHFLFLIHFLSIRVFLIQSFSPLPVFYTQSSRVMHWYTQKIISTKKLRSLHSYSILESIGRGAI